MRLFAFFFLSVYSFEIFAPSAAWALSSGPTAPEMQGFAPVGDTKMVNAFTGDFSYNIPLMDVGGYPINLTYQAGSAMEDEASWVGLGWDLSPGVIDRQLRGLPDDFLEETIKSKFAMKESFTAGLSGKAKIEALGFDLSNVGSEGLNLSVGLSYNNYNGFGLDVEPSLATRLGNANQPVGEIDLGIDLNSQDGLSVNVGGGINTRNRRVSYSLGASYSSRRGLESITFQRGPATHPNFKESFLPTGESFSYDDRARRTYGASISFAGLSQPTIPDHKINTTGLTLTAAPGGEGLWLGFLGSISGHYSKQNVKENEKDFKAYGYMYENKGRNNEEALLDVSREKDVPFIKNSVNIGIPYKTYDLFSITGQGTGGQFRLIQNDVGITFEPFVECNENQVNVGVEITAGNLGKVGVDIMDGNVHSKTQKWTTGNSFDTKAVTMAHENLKEPVYAKSNTDVTINPNTEDFIAKTGGYKPVRAELAGLQATSNLIESGAGPLTRELRDERKQQITVLNGEESRRSGYHRRVRSYPINLIRPTLCASLPAGLQSPYKPSTPQISEIVVTQPDGTRYVYGQPVYNKKQIEATFSVGNNMYNYLYVKYDAGDNGLSNGKGLDHYFSSQETPQYAYAWLLTEVLPTDYVDVTGNGVSADDLGNYIQFNYSRLQYDMHWRTPFATPNAGTSVYDNLASFQPQSKTTDGDNKGSYAYGDKEVWYLHSIESRTMYAQFFLNDNVANPRSDALGVNGEDGGLNTTNRLRYLERVSLYSKGELEKVGSPYTNATPIQTVHFGYNYSLCPGVPNTSSFGTGKLTLTSVHFTYGKNLRGEHNKYKFTYASSNPQYDQSAVDRWGNYCVYPLSTYPNRNEYPYTYQNMASAMQSAAAWNLSKIELPSGAEIAVSYEPDDYAYVQNKRAHRMYRIEGFCADQSTAPSNDIYNATATNIGDVKQWVQIHIDESMGNLGTTQDIVDALFGGNLEDFQLYFNAKMLIDPNHANVYDAVTGYCKVINDNAAVVKVDDHTLRLHLKTHEAGGKDLNPIVFAGLNYIRTSLPKVANLTADAEDGAGEQVIMSLLGMVAEIPKVLLGIFKTLLHRNCCHQIDPDGSWVRLQDPDYSKFGGGHRVKMITMTDDWDDMDSNEPGATYGKYYRYSTVLDPADPENSNDDVVISSGVASYEPLIGGEENPFRQPLSYEEKVPLVANNYYYVETPLGEALFPGPAIGYSKVTVTDITPATLPTIASALNGFSNDWSQYSKYAAPMSGTGFTVNEFYTAKEFPTVYRHTDLYFHRFPKLPSFGFPLNILQFEKASASQGFYVETNDMHGREKQTSVHSNNGAVIEYTFTEYPSRDVNLDCNKVSVVNEDGSIATKTMGVLADVYQDMRHSRVNSITCGMDVQIDISAAGIVILPLPGGWPDFQKFTKEFKSSATTKFVHRNGIPSYVETFKNGSTVRQENLYYDARTSNVLVTRTTNEYNEPIHSFTYPSHWAYSGMGPAYQNDGARVAAVVNAGVISSSALFCLQPGDEVLVLDADNTILYPAKYYVAKPQSDFVLMDPTGQLFDSYGQTVYLKVMRSGRRNMINASIGSLTSLYSPLQDRLDPAGAAPSSTFDNMVSKEFINAQANLYSEEFIPIKCNLQYTYGCRGTTYAYDVANTSIYDALKFNQQYNTVWPDHKSVLDVFTTAGFSSPMVNTINNVNTLNYWAYAKIEPTTPLVAAAPVPNDKYVAQFGAVYLTIEGVPDGAGGKKDWSFESPYYAVGDKIYKPNGSNPELVAQITLDDPDDGLCSFSCAPLGSADVNPYTKGIRGIWRPQRNYVYYSDRTPTVLNESRINEFGTIKNFEPFWAYDAGANRWDVSPSVDGNPWTWNTETTRFDDKGNATEERNALGIYSAALFDYKSTLTSAVSSNAMHREIAFDAFEDYAYKTCSEASCIMDHWNARDLLLSGTGPNSDGVVRTDEAAHTGNFSLKVPAGKSFKITRNIFNDSGNPLTVDNTHYHLASQSCHDLFNPTLEKDYIVSAWVKETSPAASYANNNLKVYFGTLLTTTLSPAGPVIDGWQRYEAKVSVPANATEFSLTFDATQTSYFDDVRIHPYDANMKSFVYDSRSLRLMATLDENNYATLYEYDDQGNLVRTKKETERGVVTLQESLQTLHPND